MDIVDQFIDSLVPGNYAITKSMEISKVKESGTLWYMKKFLILYYYIFLSNKIYNKDYKNEIIVLFDQFILSLPDELQSYAKKYFYSENEFLNFKNKNFKFFSSFIISEFSNEQDRIDYMNKAKKLYFTLLMNSGGQSGIKKRFKDIIQNESYVYKPDEIKNILEQCAIDEIIESGTTKDNSLRSILSEESLNKINDLIKKNRKLQKDDIDTIIKTYLNKQSRYKQVFNDVVAFIRNERQILYYYGYFHSKSLGTNDMEFSSLTPLGEIAINCNYYEFLALWEHQKIKMISQPPNISINNVVISDKFLKKFDISYTPYLDIISYLNKNKEFSIKEYKYIISRMKKNLSDKVKDFMFKKAKYNIEKIESHIKSFNRNRDIEDEDCRKELLKYILGIRNDIKNDKELNPLGCVEYSSNKVKVIDEMYPKIKILLSIYEHLNIYKLSLNEELFSKCCSILKSKTYNHNFSLDEYNKVKIDWDLYNISIDLFVLIGCMLTIISLQQENIDKDEFNLESIDINISEKILNQFPNICKIYKFSKVHIKNIIGEFNNAISTKNYDFFTNKDIKTINTSEVIVHKDLLNKLKKYSVNNNSISIANRERTTQLVNLLKSFYLEKEKGKKIKCECCGQYGFIKENGFSYIEFHHLIPFNKAYGPDHYLNLVALCPLCHKKLHFINLNDKSNCYKYINEHNYLQQNIIQRLQELNEQHILRSYHLEYLLADKAISEKEYNELIS